MQVKNVISSLSIPAQLLFPFADDKDKENEFLKNFEISSLQDLVTLHFSLGSTILDFISYAYKKGVETLPSSPKLRRRIEISLNDFSQICDNEGEIEVPDSWLTIVNKVMNDDAIFKEMEFFGEFKGNEKTFDYPLNPGVMNYLGDINKALLEILPDEA